MLDQHEVSQTGLRQSRKKKVNVARASASCMGKPWRLKRPSILRNG